VRYVWYDFLFTFSTNHGSISLGFRDIDDASLSALGRFGHWWWPCGHAERCNLGVSYHCSAVILKRSVFELSFSFPQIDIIGAMTTGWRVTEKTIRSVLFTASVQQLCTVQCTHIWTDLTVLWIGFCLTGSISLCLDSFLCVYEFCVSLYIICCSIVTWWGGPGGIEAWSLGLLLPSVLSLPLLVGSFDP